MIGARCERRDDGRKGMPRTVEIDPIVVKVREAEAAYQQAIRERNEAIVTRARFDGLAQIELSGASM